MPLLPILRKSPFSRLIFLYALGIALADCGRNFYLPVMAMFIVVVVLWFMLWLINKTHRNFNTGWISGTLVAILIFSCGIWAAEIDFNRQKEAESLPENISLYRAVIIDIPENQKQAVKAIARIKEIKTQEGWIRQNMKVILYIKYDSVWMPRPGSELILRTELRNIAPPSNPEEFNYRKYLFTRHIYKQSFVTTPRICARDTFRLSPRSWACSMRNKLLFSFRNSELDSTCLGLISALTLGYKDDVDAATKKAFTQAGVMHIMALSGFNVGIIALVLSFVFGIFERNAAGKFAKTLIIIVFLWLFAIITGLSPSVTRATVMISFVLTGRLFRRHVNTYNILFVSAFLLLAVAPGMLSDVSFQLSFAAVAGILVYQPFLNNLVPYRNTLVNKIWQLFTLSCSAQLATFPLALYYFHQFPVYFWLTNLYVVPLVSVIICIAGGYLALAWLEPAAFLLGKILAVLLKALLVSVTVVEKLPVSMISGVYVNGLQAALLVLFIFFLALAILFKTARLYPILIIVLIAFECVHFVNAKRMTCQQTGLISAIKRATAIHFISGKKGVLLVNADKPPDQNDLAYSFGNFWVKHGVSPPVILLDSLDPALCNGMTIPGLYCRPLWRGNNILITFNEKRIVLLRDDRFYRFRSTKPFRADFVVITNGISVHPEKIAGEIEYGLMIIDGSVTRSKRNEWKSECEENGLACYVVSEQGAFQMPD